MKNISLRTKMTLQFSILALLGLLIAGWFLFQGMSQTVQKIAIGYIQETLKQTNNNIDQILNEVENNASATIGNFEMQLLLNEALSQDYIPLGKRKQIDQYVNSGSRENEYIMSLLVYSPDYGYYGFSDDISPREIEQYASSLPEELRPFTHNMEWTVSGNDYKYGSHLFGVREIPNFLSPDSLGYYIAVVNGERLERDFRGMDLGEGGQIFLLNEYEEIMFSSMFAVSNQEEMLHNFAQRQKHDETGYYIETVDGVATLITYSQSSITDWTTIVTLPVSSLTQEISYMKNIFFWASIILIILIIISANLLSGRISKPIQHIQRTMKAVEKGNLDIRLPSMSIREMNELSGSFNHMVYRLRQLINQVYQEKVKQREAELKALQANINPHFLFNTLDSLYWMLVMKDQEQEARLILSLSNLFRYCTDRVKDEVTLETEFKQIENYLKIQQVRFVNINVTCNLDPRIRHVKVLKLLLQPLVENAIYHGLEKKTGHRQLTIVAQKRESSISIIIEDNGVGMTEEKFKVIRSHLEKQHKINNRSFAEGMGVQNVQQRIQLVHGEKYGISIKSQPGLGTRVMVILPLQGYYQSHLIKERKEIHG